MAFFAVFLDVLYRSTCVFCRVLSIFLEVILEKLWSARVFFAVFFRCSVQGSNKAFLQGSVDIPSAGAWKNCGMCPWFLLAVGEKADLSKNIARCGDMCQ